MNNNILSDPLITVGIIMPQDFPQTKYEAIHQHCQPKIEANPDEKWDEYMFAWNAVAYRFSALAEHDEKFRSAFSGTGAKDRYIQERELFGFFVTGLSTIEAFSYGLYFLLSVEHPDSFPVDNRRAITVKKTTGCLRAALPDEPLTPRLEDLLIDQTFISWEEIRNVLAHRGAPGRNISLGSSEDTWKLEDIPINPDLTKSRREWLAGLLNELFDKTYLFVEKNI